MMPSQMLGADDEDDIGLDGRGGRGEGGSDMNQHGTTTNTTVVIMPSANGSGSVTTTTVATGGAGGALTPSSTNAAPTHFHWTLRNWGGGNGQSGMQGNRRRNTSYTYSSATTTSGGAGQLNSGSATNSANDSQLDQIRVDLASPEDISLDTDSSRAMFTAAYGTSV